MTLFFGICFGFYFLNLSTAREIEMSPEKFDDARICVGLKRPSPPGSYSYVYNYPGHLDFTTWVCTKAGNWSGDVWPQTYLLIFRPRAIVWYIFLSFVSLNATWVTAISLKTFVRLYQTWNLSWGESNSNEKRLSFWIISICFDTSTHEKFKVWPVDITCF